MKIFGKILESFKRKFEEIFYDFLNFSENLLKFSEVFGNHRKICGRDQNCSETFAGVEKYWS